MDECRKCGSTHIGTRYDRALDMLNKNCCSCGYEWSVMPKDRQRDQEIEERLNALTRLNAGTGNG